jgi:hypothetical protein
MVAHWRLREAIKETERSKSFAPLIKYLSHSPQVRFGRLECALLRKLLERLTYKRKQRGRFAPLVGLSARQRNEIGRDYVRRLMRDENLTQDAALDRVVEKYPWWLAADNGLSLLGFMRRGRRRASNAVFERVATLRNRAISHAHATKGGRADGKAITTRGKSPAALRRRQLHAVPLGSDAGAEFSEADQD